MHDSDLSSKKELQINLSKKKNGMLYMDKYGIHLVLVLHLWDGRDLTLIMSQPPIKGCNGLGMETEPSGC